MHILSFSLHELFENVLPSSHLFSGLAVGRIGVRETVPKLIAIGGSVKFATQAKDVKHVVDGFGDLESMSAPSLNERLPGQTCR